MLIGCSRITTVADKFRHGVELRPHATEEIVTLVLGHASFGILWFCTSLNNLVYSNCLVPSSSDAWFGRVSIFLVDSGSRP